MQRDDSDVLKVRFENKIISAEANEREMYMSDISYRKRRSQITCNYLRKTKQDI